MKKIINGKVYDTETARELGRDGGEYGTYQEWHETLYQKRTGEYFLHGEGGPATKYAVSAGLNQWSGGSKIVPLDVAAAKAWVEEHMDADDYERLFGLPEDDDGEKVAISAQLPAAIVSAARQRAAEDGTSLTAVIGHALDAYLHTEITSDPAHRRFWFVVDDCTSTASVCDEIQLDVRTWREAIEEAQRRWDRLTVHDQRQRDAFYVGLATLDEDDIIDYNSMRYEYTIK